MMMHNRTNTERLLMCRVITAYSQFGYASDAFNDAMTAFARYVELSGQDAEKYCLRVADEFIESIKEKELETA